MVKHETYVSLETAKLLKEVGFDWECMCYYSVNTLHEPNNGFIHIYKQYEALFYDHNRTKMPVYSAPTLAVAQKWLREAKDTIIDVNSSYLPKGYGVNYCVHWKEPNKMMQAIENSETTSFYKMFSTYEEALEAGIKKCLTLILEKNE